PAPLPDRRPPSPDLRRPRRPAPLAAGGLPPPSAGPPGPPGRLVPLLLAGQAADGTRPRAAAPGRSGRREPGELRDATARPGGAGAGRRAAGGRHLHRGARAAQPGGDDAALPRPRARAPEPDPRPARERRRPRGERGQRGALEPLPPAGGGDERAGGRAGGAAARRRRPARRPGDGSRPPARPGAL